MKDQIINWLIDFLIRVLSDLNPERKAKVEAVQAQAKELDAEFQRLNVDIQSRTERNIEARKQFEALQRERETIEGAIADEQATLAQRKADRAGLSDSEKLHLDM